MVFSHLALAKSRKGFELQFNWLFVIIGGSILLAFFFMLITRQTSGSEDELGLSSQQEIDSIFRANQAASETQKLLPFDKKISFFCSSSGNDFLSEYYVGSSKVSTGYNYRVIFAPTFLESTEIIMKNAPFKSPYNVMSFIYLTNKHTEFVFVGEDTDNPFFSQLATLLPMNSTIHDSATLSSYKNTNYDHTVFLLNFSDKDLLDGKLVNFNKPTDEGRAYALLLDSAGSIADSYGNIIFYEYKPGTGFDEAGTAGFMGPELLAGAIVSHDRNLYSCELRKALLRLNFTLELHKKKLEQYSAFLPSCISSYDRMVQQMNGIQEAIGEESPALDKAHTLALDIKMLNEYLVRSTECPAMY
jgi:hypothetical protein